MSGLALAGLGRRQAPAGACYNPVAGSAPGYCTRAARAIGVATAKENGFFDGIDTTVPGLFKALRKPEPAGGQVAAGRAALPPRLALALACSSRQCSQPGGLEEWEAAAAAL